MVVFVPRTAPGVVSVVSWKLSTQILSFKPPVRAAQEPLAAIDAAQHEQQRGDQQEEYEAGKTEIRVEHRWN